MRIVINLELDADSAELLSDALTDKWREMKSMVEACMLDYPQFHLLPEAKAEVIEKYRSHVLRVERMYQAVDLARKLGSHET